MRGKKMRKILILSLCGVLLLMSAGYAAFSSALNISGTTVINSNWDVRITGITSTFYGLAKNTSEPRWDELTANLEADLYDRGDYVEYSITIENKGTIDAKLKSIEKIEADNSVITVSTSNLKEGAKLSAGGLAVLKVKIECTGTVDEEVSSDVTITLNYIQDNVGGGGGGINPGENAAEQLMATAVTTGDGLYSDEYEAGRYVYKGANPNNYITFNGELWRIISVETDGTLKIMKKGSEVQQWDGNHIQYWNQPCRLNTYFNSDYYNTLSSEAKGLIQEHIWGVGPVPAFNADLAEQIESENSKIWEGNIGLISASDYLKANTNTEQCGNYSLNNTNKDICKTTNYLVQDAYMWTMLPPTNYTDAVIFVSGDGSLSFTSPYFSNLAFPTLYLIKDITLSGSGTETSPYTIDAIE